MNRAMTALARRKTAAIVTLAIVSAALPLALYAIGSAAPPDGKGRPAGPPAAIELAPQPLRIACDGNDASTVRVRLTDDRGKPVADGTDVFFDVRYGFADPVETQTSKGEAFSDIRLYPFASSQPEGPAVTVYAGELRASINLICDGTGDPGCNPFSPPQHPMSPPCPTPEPSLPSAGCAPAASDPDPEYGMYLRAEEQVPGIITVYAGLDDLGGGNYQAAQWSICRSPILAFLSVEPEPGAPPECVQWHDNGERTLLGCIDFTGPNLNTFGDVWTAKYACLREGKVRFYLGRDQTFVAQDASRPWVPISVASAELTCTQPGAQCGGVLSPPCPALTATSTHTVTVTPTRTPSSTPCGGCPSATPTLTIAPQPTATPCIPCTTPTPSPTCVPGSCPSPTSTFTPTVTPTPSCNLSTCPNMMRLDADPTTDDIDTEIIRLVGETFVVDLKITRVGEEPYAAYQWSIEVPGVGGGLRLIKVTEYGPTIGLISCSRATIDAQLDPVNRVGELGGCLSLETPPVGIGFVGAVSRFEFQCQLPGSYSIPMLYFGNAFHLYSKLIAADADELLTGASGITVRCIS